MPLPGPPLENVQARRIICHMVAYNTCGFFGSIARVIAPVSSLTYKIFFQLLPPSLLLYTPPSGLGPNKCPSAATYTTSGLSGATMIQVMMRVSFKPMLVQVLPPSLLLYIPAPVITVLRGAESPLPA